VAFAARFERGVVGEARLVVSAIAAKPKVVGGLADLILGRPLDDTSLEAVAAAAHRQCHPIINVAYDADWRRAMVPVFVKRAMRDARDGAPS
jgi:CO/xanthine dehydrogenase FAD-binding subunit